MSIVAPTIRPIVSAIVRGLVSGGGADPLVFHAITYDPDTYEMLGVKTGTGDLTEARTSTIYAADHENVYRAFSSGEACYTKGRVVRNYAMDTDELDAATWSAGSTLTITSGATDPLGGSTAYTLKNTSGATQLFRDVGVISDTSREVRFSCWVRRRTGTGVVQIYSGASSSASTAIEGVITSSWQRIAADVATPDGSAAERIGFYMTALNDEIDIWHPQLEDVTGQSNQAPGEYVENAASSGSAHKVFANALGNSVDGSNVVTEAVGPAFDSQLTNSITHSRDLTNAAWGSTNITTTYDQVGLDGVANTASLLDDSDAANIGLEEEVITIPDDSNTHVLRVFIQQDSTTSRFPGVFLNLGGGTQQQALYHLNTQTGATAQELSTGTVDVDVRDVGGVWWELLVSVTNNSTGNTSATVRVYPARGTSIGTSSAAATGSIIVGNVELHENATISDVKGADPIYASGTAVTQDFKDTPWLLAQAALTNSLIHSKPDTSNWSLTEGAKNLGSDQVTNGGFDSDSDWTKGTGWSISGGVASCDGTQVGNSLLEQANILTVGSVYKVVYTVSNYSAGNVRALVGQTGYGFQNTANGTYVEYLTASGDDDFIISANADFVGDIDDVTVEEVEQLVVNGDFAAGDDGNWTKGTGWSIGSGVASCDGTQTAASNLLAIGTLSEGIYKCTFTVSNYSAGQVRMNISSAGAYKSANGTYTQYLSGGSGSNPYIQADADFVGDIDDIIVIPAVVESNTTGLDGASDSAVVLTDDDTGTLEYLYESVTIPDDSNTNVLRVFVKKDADTSRFPVLHLDCRNGTTQRTNVYLNTSTGAGVEYATIGTTDFDIRDAGDWWEVLASVTNNGTGNTSAFVEIFPAYSTSFGGSSSAAATGSITVGNVELHLNTTIAAVRGSGPIFTSGSSVTTNATELSFDDANHDDTQGGYYCECYSFGADFNLESSRRMQILSVGISGSMFEHTATTARSYDGTNSVVSPSLGINGTESAYAIGNAYGDGNLRVNADGSWGTAGSYDGAFNNGYSELRALSHINSASISNTPQLIRNIRRYDQSYSAAQTTIDGLMA